VRFNREMEAFQRVIWDLKNFKMQQEDRGAMNVEHLVNTTTNWL